jgi:hypothetical protein
MVYKQSFEYLKNKKINFIEVIVKLEYLLCQKIYIKYIANCAIFH